MSFQRNVSVIALIVLSIAFIIVGIVLLRMRKNVKFPANVAQCPDYFDVVKNDEGEVQCKFNHKSGSDVHTFYSSLPPSCKELKPEDPEFIGVYGEINKCNWAKQCGITWDGISNQNIC